MYEQNIYKKNILVAFFYMPISSIAYTSLMPDNSKCHYN